MEPCPRDYQTPDRKSFMSTAPLELKLTRTAGAWPTTRILFALAGTVTLLSASLAATVSPWFLLLTVVVGVNQLLYVTAGACPASLLIDRRRSATSSSVMLGQDHHEET